MSSARVPLYIIVIKHSSHWTQASVLRFSCSVLSTCYSECTILCAQNDDVDHINETILKSSLGELKSYCNIDKIINILEAHYSSEYLNSINASGLPLLELNLKVGCPIVILCNLDPANGLCVVGGRMWQWGVG